MSKIGDFAFVEPLDSDGASIKTVFLYDGYDIWAIDSDGDLFYWDNEVVPQFPHEVRRTDLFIGPADKNARPSDEEVQRAFNESPLANGFDWNALFLTWHN